MRFYLGQNGYIFLSMSGQFLLTVYIIKPEMKLIADVLSLLSFWLFFCQKFISFAKISCKHYLKWNQMKRNIYTYIYFIKTRMNYFYYMSTFSNHTRIEISNSFRPQWKVMQTFLLWKVEISFWVDFILGLI